MTSRLLPTLALLALSWVPAARAASAADDRFAAAERARYAALCHAHKNLDSCSDAVRWSPGDPELLVTLADALVRAGRLPEAIRDYQHAAAIEPHLRGLDAKLTAAQARLAERHRPRRLSAARPSGETELRHYSNLDPEAESH